MAPGETRSISTGTTLQVQFTSGSGQQLQTTLTLPPVTVAAEHIISLAPGTQTVDLSSPAPFTVQLTNPSSTDVTYILSTIGLDGFTTTLAASVTVPAGQTVTTPLDINVPLTAAADMTGFEVLATTTGGGSDSVEGELTVLQQVALQTRAVSLGISPMRATAGQGTSAQYILTITNVGSIEDTYSLAVSGLPQGVTATFGQTTIDVPPRREQLPRRAAHPDGPARNDAGQLSLHRHRDVHERSDRDRRGERHAHRDGRRRPGRHAQSDLGTSRQRASGRR